MKKGINRTVRLDMSILKRAPKITWFNITPKMKWVAFNSSGQGGIYDTFEEAFLDYWQFLKGLKW